MVVTGIGLGFAAAFCQSLSYLATRFFVTHRGGSSRRLLVLSHVIMGVASAAVLPLIWPAAVPWHAVLGPLVLCVLFYLLGQIGLMVALRHAEPSRISPMLAFKLVILAGLTLLLTTNRIAPVQWIAIALCLAGTLALNYSGGTNHPKAAGALVFMCLAYSFSDWNITRLVKSMQHIPLWQASMWSALASYTLAGALAVMFLPWFGSRDSADWKDAAPFAGAWLGAMLFLFACFGTVGVVYGNILQSTRGLISVFLGFILARAGWLHLDQCTSRALFARRLAAAALMTVAVVLWVWPVRS